MISGGLLVAFLGVTQQAESAPQIPLIGVKEIPQNRHPLASLSEELAFLHGFTTQPLVAANSNREWKCLLCTEIPDPPTEKNLKVKWVLKKGLKWADGVQVTSKDFVLSWEIIAQLRKADSSQTPHFNEISSVVALGQNSLEITYAQVTPDYYKVPFFYPTPSHLERQIWVEANGDLDLYWKKSLYSQQAKPPAGLHMGPFYVFGYEPGKRVRLKRNPHYRLAVHHEKITLLTFKNPNEWKWVISQGKLDLVSPNVISFFDALKAKRQDKNQYPIVFKDTSTLETLMFNKRNPLFGNLEFRKALVYLTDRDTILSEVFFGAKSKAENLSASFDVDAQWKWTFVPSKGHQILEDLGWKRNEKGNWFKPDDGVDLKMDLVINKDSPYRRHLAERLKANWEKQGILLTITEVSEKQFQNDIVGKSKFKDMILMSWQTLPHISLKALFHSKEIPSYENDYHGQNIGAWRSSSLDTLFQKSELEMDKAERMTINAEIYKLFENEIPELPLFYHDVGAILSEGLKNFQMGSPSFPASLDSNRWKLVKTETPSHKKTETIE